MGGSQAGKSLPNFMSELMKYRGVQRGPRSVAILDHDRILGQLGLLFAFFSFVTLLQVSCCNLPIRPSNLIKYTPNYTKDLLNLSVSTPANGRSPLNLANF